MAYLIGQYNKNEVDSDIDNAMLTPFVNGQVCRTLVSLDQGVWSEKDSLNDYFRNEAYVCGDKEIFKADQTYYVHVQIKRLRTDQTFRIKLLVGQNINSDVSTNDFDTHQQYIKTIHIAPDYSIDHSEWVDCEFIFTPLQDFNVLFFEMVRNSDDFRIRINNNSNSAVKNMSIQPRFASILFLEVSKVNNLLEFANHFKSPGIKEFLKMGVIGESGLMMCINREEIHIGKTGIYEVKNGLIKVNFFAVVRGLRILDEDKETIEKKKDYLNRLLGCYEYPEEYKEKYINQLFSDDVYQSNNVITEDSAVDWLNDQINEVISPLSSEEKEKITPKDDEVAAITSEQIRYLYQGKSSTSYNFCNLIAKTTVIEDGQEKEKFVGRNIPPFSIDYTYIKEVS